MSGEPEGRSFQPPSRPPEGKPFRKPFGKPFAEPGAGFRRDFGGPGGGRPEGSPPLRPGQWRRPEGQDFSRPNPRAERPNDPAPTADSEPGPHAGKFYERYAKRPKAPRPAPFDPREEREPARPAREFQSSEHPQRLASSAGARNFDDRRDDRPRPAPYPRRDDGPERGRPLRPDEGREPMGASSGIRRNFDSSARRDDFQQRDDRPDPRDRPYQRPFDRRDTPPPRDDRSGPPPERREFQGDDRPYRPRPAAPLRDDARDQRPDDRRPWQERPRPDYRDDNRSDSRRRPVGPAPHLEHRIIRSEGAKADQPLPERSRPEAPGPLSAARDLAARVLLRRLQGNAFVEDLLDDAFATTKMRPDDRRLAQELVYGCVRWQTTLDWLIARKTEDRPQQPNVQIFLRLGLYQLFFLDRIPPHAACYETVELAKRLGLEFQANFINAILRRSDAERATLTPLLAELKTTQPHLGYSHPDWLVQRWTERWGPDDTRRLLEWNNTAPPTHVRVNTLKTDPTKLIERWRLHENVEYDFVRCPWTEEGHVFTLKTHPSLANLDSFRAGGFYVQDPSTLLAVQALDPWAGESILDLCAAPGGKTAYIAQKMENDGELLACDLTADRLRLVTENCTRLGVTCVKTLALGDFPEAALIQMKFDKALVDAPCSNTGVLRRRIDLRWRLQPEEIARLRETQLKLLRLAAAHLKPGGTLVYSTCSLEPEENTEVVQEFLTTHPQFKLESEQSLLPFRDGVDGAYVAKLRS